jgi:hypothetical protein
MEPEKSHEGKREQKNRQEQTRKVTKKQGQEYYYNMRNP